MPNTNFSNLVISKRLIRKDHLYRASLSELDTLMTYIIRKKGKCEICGEKNIHQLTDHHIIPKRNIFVRWDFRNHSCLCSFCHRKVHIFGSKISKEFREKNKNLIDELNLEAHTSCDFYKLYEKYLPILEAEVQRLKCLK